MNLKKKKKGFTLIELMAVIAIIAILAAVLVPTVSGYINRSKKSAIITQIRTVVNAVEVYNSTAPTTDQITSSITELITANSSTTDKEKLLTSFQNQDLLKTSDVTKLNGGLTYGQLQEINSDSNSMNNIYKNDTDKFEYKGGDITTAVQVES